MSGNLYRKLCDRSDPSEMLVTAKMPLLQLGEVALPEKPFVLVLDRPSDTGNLGSIIRSANSFGVDAVLCIGHGVDPWDPKTIRASLGSIFFTTPIQIESLEEFQNLLESMRGRYGIKVWGTDSGGDLTLDTCVLQRPLVLILGNEAKGISQALKVVCDGIISIPVTGAVNSLNIASAASIFMWEVFKDSEWIA
jgi:TrmH family RNA methyltransferase